ncbi:esterase/lipase family protein [Nocardia nova]|uniref:esterase/lipase family protein n=1 Tax=Nocardia nova TaxID=37330 RepID=UPI00189477DA|nr:alpha/beta fold hydrolase [Nocardia nova]MBF6148632.1 alpha/beta fold hydrolase [Nocardia nova]MDN2495533.1 alpha/beta fold hydrolase [Nocardia nova]
MSDRQEEIEALARLAGDELGGAVDGIAAVHRAVADHVFAAVRLGVGPAARPAQVVHDTIADNVYRIVSGSAVAAGTLAGHAATFSEVPTPSRTVFGSGLLAALQGLIGDTLAQQRPILAAPMAFRSDGDPVAPERLVEHVTNPSSRVVIFLHGLAETEHAWRLGGRPTYAERLEADLGCTSLQVRYNSGLHISENAQQLNDLLQRLAEHWPVEIEQLSLVGHSMGGLIARSACFDAAEERRSWVRHVRQLVCLGSPHLGAPLEQIVHYLSAALVRVPETRPFGRLLRRRSAGIRDLRHGSLVDQDWDGVDADALRRKAIREIPLLEGADHYFVTATITRSPRNPLGHLIGDGLVLTTSGSGRNRARRIGFDDDNGLHLPGANHFTLLNHEAVYEALTHWLRGEREQKSLRPG